MKLLKDKWLFVSTRKCATNGMYDSLPGERIGPGFHPRPNGRMAPVHWTIVRNPYDRAVSIWASIWQRSGDRYGIKAALKKEDASFEEFAKLCLTGNLDWAPPELNPWLLTNQADWIDGMIIDRVVHFENLREEISEIVGAIDLKTSNASKHAPWQDYMTPETIRIINEWAAADFEQFGYEKLDPSTAADKKQTDGEQDMGEQKKILVVSLERNGTQAAAELLQSIGFDVLHEKMGRDGIVHWQFAADFDWVPIGLPKVNGRFPGRTQYAFDKVIHIMRDPVKAISACLSKINTRCHSIQFIEQVCPSCRDMDDNIQKAARIYLEWHRMCHQLADISIRTEEMHEQIPAFLGKAELSAPIVRNATGKDASQVWHKPYVKLTEQDLAGYPEFHEAMALYQNLDKPDTTPDSAPQKDQTESSGQLAAYEELMKDPATLAMLKSAVESGPASEVDWFNYGICLKMQEYFNEAVEAFLKVQELNPSNAAIYPFIIRTMDRAGNRTLLVDFVTYCRSALPEIYTSIAADPSLTELLSQNVQTDAMIEEEPVKKKADRSRLSYTHIINPVGVPRESEFYNIQRVTFAAMEQARQQAEELDIELMTAQYAEDHDIIPASFVKTSDMTRSVLDVASFPRKRKLPFVGDILQKALEESTSDYVIFTNVDIIPSPDFYQVVNRLVESGHEAFSINRRTVERYPDSPDSLDAIFKQEGKAHGGHDCFVFPRRWIEQFNLGHVIVGAPWIGVAMLVNMACLGKGMNCFRDLKVTRHLGDDMQWKSVDNQAYRDFNAQEMTVLFADLQNRYGAFPEGSYFARHAANAIHQVQESSRLPETDMPTPAERPKKTIQTFMTGVTGNQEWMLKWWYRNITKHNPDAHVTICDFGGMSDEIQVWAKRHANCFIQYPEGECSAGDLKTRAMIDSPYAYTCWVDVNCEVLKPINDIFDYAQPGIIGLIADHVHVQQDSKEQGWSTGISLICGTPGLLTDWHDNAAKTSVRDDRESLRLLLTRHPERNAEIVELPQDYLWSRQLLTKKRDHSGKRVIHWTGPKGKAHIREILMKENAASDEPVEELEVSK
ncbi:MAG: hypothetical protein JXR25_04965 [Pontiellaceae bacterium]|nr:hypothetical protein [Pontiellaceae bacterium]MBN2784158.1 hypothetical protein [Pontiellaceae bacterium]